YLDLPPNPPTSVPPLTLKELYSSIVTGTTMTTDTFVNAVYIRAAKDVFWRRNVSRILEILKGEGDGDDSRKQVREEDALRCMFKVAVGEGKGTKWGGVRKVVEGMVRRGKDEDDRTMSSLIKDVERDVDEEGRT
ncbi:hypothetical protein TrRE_jg4727, partial [Triparma retinervis]